MRGQRFRLHSFVVFPAGRQQKINRRIQEIVLKKVSLVGVSSLPKILLTENLNFQLLKVELATLTLNVIILRVILDMVMRRTL